MEGLGHEGDPSGPPSSVHPEEVLPFQEDAPETRFQETGQQFEEGGFPRTVGSQKTREGSSGKRQRNVLQPEGREIGISIGKFPGFQEVQGVPFPGRGDRGEEVVSAPVAVSLAGPLPASTTNRMQRGAPTFPRRRTSPNAGGGKGAPPSRSGSWKEKPRAGMKTTVRERKGFGRPAG